MHLATAEFLMEQNPAERPPYATPEEYKACTLLAHG